MPHQLEVQKGFPVIITCFQTHMEHSPSPPYCSFTFVSAPSSSSSFFSFFFFFPTVILLAFASFPRLNLLDGEIGRLIGRSWNTASGGTVSYNQVLHPKPCPAQFLVDKNPKKNSDSCSLTVETTKNSQNILFIFFL